MLVTSQLSVQTTKNVYSLLDMHLCPPLWKWFRHPSSRRHEPCSSSVAKEIKRHQNTLK